MAALTTALLALSAANTVSGFVGGRRAATAAEQQGNYQGSIFDMNAGIADKQATDAIVRGDQAAGQSRAESRVLSGSQHASQAAEGIDTTSGSAADVVANDKALGELDVLNIQQNAQRESYGYKVEAANQRAQGNLARMGGRNQAASLRNGAAGTLLSGAMDMYNLYHTFGKTAPSAARRANDALDKRGVGSLIGTTPNYAKP